MEEVEKKNLKLVALLETSNKRLEESDDRVADLRVALTELNQTLQSLQQEFEDYKIRYPEEPDVPQEPEDASPEE